MNMNKNEIIESLKLADPADIENLFARARKAREDIFSDKIFPYGFIYFSTWCKNNCNFCYYRSSNDIERYRKSREEILSIAEELAETGVNLLDLTMGEDEAYHGRDFADFSDIVKEIKDKTGLPVMISPGVIQDGWINRLADIGAEWYALYQETHNRDLFAKLRINQDYDSRMHAKLFAKDRGMFIEEGIMTGIGESVEDIADSILEMGNIDAKQVRVMSFVPQPGTPMGTSVKPQVSLELKIIALMRIQYPWSLIPASLDVDGIAGLKDRINAGANVVTSIIPPTSGLLGVAQSSMDVASGGRTVAEVSAILSGMGLTTASPQMYRDYLKKLRT